MSTVEIVKITDSVELPITLSDGATVPTYATEGAAGMDVRTIEDVLLQPMDRKLVRTGIHMAIPPGFEIQVRPRSGLALKHGISLVNSPGTIDSDYRGELGIIMINLGAEPVSLNKGDHIAQLVLAPVVKASVVVVEQLDETERGGGGFGSTGKV